MYQETKAPPILSKYIDAFWTNSIDLKAEGRVNRVLPDTCTDLVFSMGADIHANSVERTVLKSDTTYLLGTMTRYSDVEMPPGAHVFGIRFHPFGLEALLGLPLAGTTNKRIELGRPVFDFRKFIRPGTCHFDLRKLVAAFAGRLPASQGRCFDVFNSIVQRKGVITIAELSRAHRVSERQLERMFRQKAGMTVKELCSQVRLLNLISLLKSGIGKDNLLDIAIQTGFYDHAHLSHTVKRYTGYSPTEFMK